MKFTTAEKPITTTSKKLGELKVEGSELEIPQVESTADAVTFFGSEEKWLEFTNAQIETEAKNAGRVILRDAEQNEGESVTDAIARCYAAVKEKVKGWTYGGTRTKGAVSQKEAQKRVNDVLERVKAGQELTKEEILALLQNSK